jgi:hypothetical protein
MMFGATSYRGDSAMSSRPSPSTHIQIGNVIVARTPIGGSNCVAYSAWQLAPGSWPKHGTQMSFNGVAAGRIGSEPIPDGIDQMARGDERVVAVKKFYADCNERAYHAILAAFPEAAKGTKTVGEIEVWTTKVDAAA